MFEGYINWPVFFVSLAAGAVFVYLSSSATKTIFVYPTPDNVGRYVYLDEAGTCYQFQPSRRECKKDDPSVKDIPAQIVPKGD
jgi:hypothetical protein